MLVIKSQPFKENVLIKRKSDIFDYFIQKIKPYHVILAIKTAINSCRSAWFEENKKRVFFRASQKKKNLNLKAKKTEIMVKETGRKCSYCGNNGHNSRTCNGKGGCFKLFGVNIGSVNQKQENLLKKSLSLGNLPSHAEKNNDNVVADVGYLSDGQIHSRNSSHERKRGRCFFFLFILLFEFVGFSCF